MGLSPRPGRLVLWFRPVTKKPSSSHPSGEITVARALSHLVNAGARGQAYLVVIAGARIGQNVLVADREVEIGRGINCALQLDADSVSRQHARVRWNGAAHEVVDLNSTNGTYVNERRVAGAFLSDGDRLQVGHVILKYIAGSNVEAEYHREVQRLVKFDGLTGVANRAYFDETLADTLLRTRSRAAPVSLIVLDLDHFKLVNDTHGHTAGDAVLRQAAAVAQGVAEGAALFARTGGEEFAVILPGVALDAARTLAERIRAAIEAAEITFEGRRIPMTVSLGVAERPARSAESAEDLFRRADERLYEAKSAGRNRVR